MAFRGDIAQIPLSYILQALMMNGQEGILTLESEAFRAKLFILQTGIRPLNFEREDPDLLKHILLKQKLLTELQFQNVFSTWVPGSTHPGDFLINRRILSPETVESELRQQLGLSVEALADNCGLHRTYVGSVERGERNLTLSSLRTLAQALDVRLSDMLKGLD